MLPFILGAVGLATAGYGVKRWLENERQREGCASVSVGEMLFDSTIGRAGRSFLLDDFRKKESEIYAEFERVFGFAADLGEIYANINKPETDEFEAEFTPPNELKFQHECEFLNAKMMAFMDFTNKKADEFSQSEDYDAQKHTQMTKFAIDLSKFAMEIAMARI